MSARLRWGIAGTGTIAHSMVHDLRLLGADVVAVFSRSGDRAEAFASEHGIAVATADHAAFVDRDDIDIVYVATPFTTHHALSLQALRAGKHVLVEKPIATSAAEASQLFEVAADARRFLMEGMWLKFNPAYVRLRELLAEGMIGEPRSLRAGFGFPLPRDGGSRWNPAGSPGALLDQGIYAVTLAQALFGNPIGLDARGTVQPDGTDLTSHVSLTFEGDRVAHFTTSITEFADPSASIAGTAGWIRMPGMFWAAQALDLHAGGWREMMQAPPRLEFPFEGKGYVPMLRSVEAEVAGGALVHSAHGAEETVATMRTLDEIRALLAR